MRVPRLCQPCGAANCELQRLGVNEDKAIESRLITRRIEAAAREIASRVPNDFAADSAEQWVERNCPDLWIKLQR